MLHEGSEFAPHRRPENPKRACEGIFLLSYMMTRVHTNTPSQAHWSKPVKYRLLY